MPANEYRPFRIAGRFLHDKEARVFTSLSDAKGPQSGPGYWIVTPLAVGGGVVMVNRGFAPQGRETPVESPNLFTPRDRPEANVFFARNAAAIAAAKRIGGPVAPFTLDLTAAATPPGGLPQAGETRMLFSNNHLGYAVTWYGLAAALLAVFASAVWARRRDVTHGLPLTRPRQAP